MLKQMNRKHIIDYPAMIAEWDYDKNSHIDLDRLTSHSTIKAWWKCRLGHSYLQPIYVHFRGSGCPYCGHVRILKGFNDLASQFPDLANQMDEDKNNGMTPDMIMPHSRKKIWWKCSQNHSWKACVNSRSNGQGCPYCAGKRILKGYNDLKSQYPMIASEWDVKKNSISPDMVASCSSFNAWWICPNGHPYQMHVYYRTSKRLNCPVCSGRRIVAGINDLCTLSASLVSEWDFEKNGSLTPDKVTTFSNNKVWWKCCNGHSWRTAIYNRSNGTSCPYCGNRKLLSGYNDVRTKFPFLGDYWDFEMNSPLNPSNIMPSYSRKKISWKCPSGHKWKSSLSTFLIRPECPYCDGRKKPGISVCLSENYPLIASEWDFEKNSDFSPETVSAGSSQSVWWKCPKGHSYKKRICSRVHGSSCPYCSGRFVSEGINDLATLSPTIASEWDYDKNFPLKPNEISRGSSKNIWWRCEKGHSWSSKVSARTNGEGCPFCHKMEPYYSHLI